MADVDEASDGLNLGTVLPVFQSNAKGPSLTFTAECETLAAKKKVEDNVICNLYSSWNSA